MSGLALLIFDVLYNHELEKEGRREGGRAGEGEGERE